MLTDYGYYEDGSRWILKRERGATIALIVLGLFLLGIGLALIPTAKTTGELIWSLVLGGVGATLLLFTWRNQTSVDLNRRAFVLRQLVGERLFPFERVQNFLPVKHYVNGVFQGVYYMVEPTADGPKLPPLRISNHFPDLTSSYEQTLRQVMKQPF